MSDSAFSRGAAWIEGEVVPVERAKIPILDWGFLHSDATYDVAHVWKGAFFRLDDHIDRFLNNARRLRLNVGHDAGELVDKLTCLVATTGLRDAYVEMVCTRGLPAPGSRDPRTCTNRFFCLRRAVYLARRRRATTARTTHRDQRHRSDITCLG